MPRRLLVAACLLLGLSACSTQRSLVLATDPPGATAWINGKLADRPTPFRIPFIYYQTFEVRLEKEGYQTFAGPVSVGGQLDGYPIVDLPSELTRRHRGFSRTIKLERLPPRPDEAGVAAVMEQAREMRRQAREEAEAARARFRPAR